MVWWLLSIGAVGVLLTYSRKGKNAVWGTATVGALIGMGIAVYQPGFEWWLIGKSVVIATFIGLAFEWLPQLARLWSR